MRVLDDIRAKHPSGCVVVASHGNLIALALNAVDPEVDYDFWENMPMPAVYRLRFESERWLAEGPGLG